MPPDFFVSLHPVVQALFAALFTWAMTAAGSAAVFFSREASNKLLDTMLGFAAGVMIAASFWSLLVPAIEMSQGNSMPVWFPASAGFLAGALFLGAIDRLLPHLHIGFQREEAEGIKTSWPKTTLLILAITLHNIPEGLAVGVAFGSLASGLHPGGVTAALALAVGIGIQNLPEGIAVSMPLRHEGMSRLKSFWFGQLSAVVEPVAAVIGAFAVLSLKPILPYALGFAAGAMIFVVVEELIPESQRSDNTDLATMGTITGFVLMMVLDVAFS